MAFLGKTYAQQNEAPPNPFDPLPSGDYPAMIIDSDMKPTREGDGHYLECAFQVIDGPHKGRQLWARLNLDNPNEKAVKIAEREFAALRFACGVGEINDSTLLHNKPILIRVEYMPARAPDPKKNKKGRDKAGNEIRDYKRLDGTGTVAAPGPAANTAGAPAAAAPPQQQSTFPGGAPAAGAPAAGAPSWAGGQ